MGEFRIGRWADEWTGAEGVYVIGTHDVAAATPVAEQAVRREYSANGVVFDRVGHWRLDDPGDTTDPTWIEDPVNGERAVQFTAICDTEDGAS